MEQPTTGRSGNRTRSYLFYAFGEVFLVMIGILLALQVNNWNEERVKIERLVVYYEQIVDELEAALERNTHNIESSQELIRLNKRSLNLLNSTNPDSLNALEQTLGALGTAWATSLTLPVLTDFLENNLSEVKDPESKKYFRFMQSLIEDTRRSNEYLWTQYRDAIEPYFVRNINYQRVALEQYQSYLVPGGPKNDFSRFKGDMELWNLITFKLELTQDILADQNAFNELAKDFITVLQAEIENQD